MNDNDIEAHNLSKLKRDSKCDNVLLEYRLAVELHHRGCIEKIFPLMIGDIIANTGVEDSYSNYFGNGCHPVPVPDYHVESVEGELNFYLDSQALGAPFVVNHSVDSVLNIITACQGAFIEGQKGQAFDTAAASIYRMCAKNTEIEMKHEKSESTILIVDELKAQNHTLLEEVRRLKSAIQQKNKHLTMSITNTNVDYAKIAAAAVQVEPTSLSPFQPASNSVRINQSDGIREFGEELDCDI